MSDLEDFDDISDVELAAEQYLVPMEQPMWAKVMAWATIGLSTLYVLNPTAGVFELIPDVLPIVGNLDEAAAMFLLFGAMRFLGMRMPDFIERWTQPLPQLPDFTDREEE